jgi:hypothetical protein
MHLDTAPEIPYIYRALLDLLTGFMVFAPLIYALESTISYCFDVPALKLSAALRRIALPEAVILFTIGLVWTLVLTVSNNIGLSWNW